MIVILLWLSNDKKYEIEYSETDGDKITISENCYDKLIQYLRNNIDIKGDSEEDIMNYVNENQLFHSQLESLIVALELVWRIASIKFKDSDAASDNSVERNHGRAIRPYLSLNPQNKNKEISYEFVPGPFMRIYVQAINHPEEDYLLLIEEINRANVAAVFGDVFQLLDRKNGVSEYPIATSEDIKTYLLENLDCLKGKNIDDLTEEEREKYFEMRIPANMYIWATMNSADQGVFPMDTAFKRRWEFEYLSVNDDEQVAAIKDYVIPMCIKDNKADHYIGWDSLRTRINNILTSEKCKVNEDKLLGPFFISKNMLDEIKNNKEQVDELEAKDEASRTEKDNEALKDMHQKENSYIKAFESKVIMYLFEDVMKMRPENIFIGHHKKNGKMIFSEICKAFEQDGEGIFGIDDLENI